MLPVDANYCREGESRKRKCCSWRGWAMAASILQALYYTFYFFYGTFLMFIVILNGGGGHVSANSVQVYRSYKSGGDAKSSPVQGWGAMFFFVVLVALPLQLCQIFLANQAYRIFDAINNKDPPDGVTWMVEVYLIVKLTFVTAILFALGVFVTSDHLMTSVAFNFFVIEVTVLAPFIIFVYGYIRINKQLPPPPEDDTPTPEEVRTLADDETIQIETTV
ncbi:uncharacterized protein LOC118436785 isoform X1 [Folsomia candida]|uniref:Ribosomal RNA large subunit methyltransferase H n=1 Tax=Folsomia candida TaxID=158441 RepID=A0A226DZX7_FOLCA|nr:uncharacterized protein LOC118436785 isoform X1 [Folsomia candida]OXA49756.1 Ribosomal RNA large subunit methyltransferase H [Folsomia candida]